MYIRPFRYLGAHSLEEATTALREYGSDVKLLAGGQSLLPMLNFGLMQVDALIDLAPIPSMQGIASENGSLRIGALTLQRTMEESGTLLSLQPLVVEAVRHVGNPRVRNRGTVGGSLSHNDPSAELPAVMAALGAVYELSNGRDIRTVAARDFSVGMFTTQLHEDEVLTSVIVPNLGGEWGWGFHEFSYREGDFALVAAAAVARCNEGVIQEMRLALAGVADGAVLCSTFQEAAEGQRIDKLSGLMDAVQEDISPLDDPIAPAGYRRRLASVIGWRAVMDACLRAGGGT